MTNLKKYSGTAAKLLVAIVILLGLGSASLLRAQPYTNILRGFNVFEEALTDVNPTTVVIDWIDNDGYNGNGCMVLHVPWADTGGGWQEVQLAWGDPVPWPGLVAAPYATVEYDVKVVGTPDAGTDGTYGAAQIVLQGWPNVGGNGPDPTPANWVPLGTVALTNAGGWQHISHRLIPFEPYNANKVVFNIIGRNCTNAVTYYLDNIEFKVPTNSPPSITMGAAPPAGLHLVTAGGPGDRQIIRTAASNLRWYARPGSVKYAFTVDKFPSSATYPNYMAFMLLVPYAPGTTAPDWNGTNVVRLDVQNHDTGMAYLRFKTNAPNSNGGFYTPVADGGGSYPGVPSSTLIGEWSLTFVNNTNVTVTTPDGTSSNYVFNAAADFNGLGFRVYFGAQANTTENIGQEVILSAVNITGTATVVTDTFSDGVLDSTKWQVQAAQPNNVYELGAVAYNLSWGLPDNLFKLITSPDLNNMTNSGLSTTVGVSTRAVNIPFNYPSASSGFFALAQRAYTKLQVLMPGETPAPGTTIGKAGAPASQKAGVPFQVTVKAVDDNWNQAFSSHPVSLWSTPGDDGSGFQWFDQLVHGSYSYTFTNTTAGTFQITAQDNADTNITAVGSSYTVVP